MLRGDGQLVVLAASPHPPPPPPAWLADGPVAVPAKASVVVSSVTANVAATTMAARARRMLMPIPSSAAGLLA
jgi:hypothetical protein